MKFSITSEAIDREELRAGVLNPSSGACDIFEGWIRDHNDGKSVLRLEYEVYRPIAIQEGDRVIQEALDKFDIVDAACVHREGMLELSDTAVVAIAVAAHRDEAFLACRYIIDEVKHRLPIWKKETYENGDAEWVNCQNCSAAGHSLSDSS